MPKVSSGVPTLLAFTPISLSELRDLFLAHHEHVLKSSVATVRRYRAATKHIQDFIERQRKPLRAHEVRPDSLRLMALSMRRSQAESFRTQRGELIRNWARSSGRVRCCQPSSSPI